MLNDLQDEVVVTCVRQGKTVLYTAEVELMLPFSCHLQVTTTCCDSARRKVVEVLRTLGYKGSVVHA